MIKTAQLLTPIGPVTLAAEGNALAALWMEKQRFFGVIKGRTIAPSPGGDSGEPVLRQAKQWLDRYFTGQRPDPREIPLAPCGSDFQRRVWEMLLDIPYGEVITYGRLAACLAERRGRPVAPQAIGAAVGRNPISVIIPCHRVVAAGGKIGGYGGGIRRKEFLLNLEREGDFSIPPWG